MFFIWFVCVSYWWFLIWFIYNLWYIMFIFYWWFIILLGRIIILVSMSFNVCMVWESCCMSRWLVKWWMVNLIVYVVFMYLLVFMKFYWFIWFVVCWKMVWIFYLLIELLMLFYCLMNWWLIWLRLWKNWCSRKVRLVYCIWKFCCCVICMVKVG